MATHIQVKYPKSMAFVLMFGAFIGVFGETALNMALTEIMEQYSIGPATAQWLTTGYLLVLAILVPISAFIMRWFTTKQLIIGALGISLLGSIFAALAFNFPILLLGRVVQAIGTGLLIPTMMNVILLIFPMNRRAMVLGIMGLVITTAPAIGPTLSGVIISTLSWNYIFWISAVLYFVIILFGFPKLTNVGEVTKPKIDILSIFLSTIGFGGIVYGFSAMAENTFTVPIVWGPLVAGVIALFLFGVRQTKMAQPMINLSVFKYPMFSLGTCIMFMTIIIILGTGILLPIYLKSALLLSAITAGLVLLPGNAVSVVMAPIVGGLFDRVGARKFNLIGFFFVSVATISFMFIISATTPLWQIIVVFMILFFGISMIMMPAQTNALNELPRDLYADGSAAMNTLNQVAGSLGTALAITLFSAGQASFEMNFPNATGVEVLAAGIKYVFYFIVGLAILGLILAFFVRKPELKEVPMNAERKQKEVVSLKSTN